jgi:DNA-directed RNA polymerase subunit N (RpoN/RPB10)
MTETEFDVDCYDCGAPVAVEWNEKKWMYETMKEENREKD